MNLNYMQYMKSLMADISIISLHSPVVLDIWNIWTVKAWSVHECG